MSTHEAIVSIKGIIKRLAAEQREAKKGRKGCSSERMPSLWGEIWCRSARITACLNFYHALRGSAHKHGVVDSFLDRKYTEELMKEYATATTT